MQQVRVWHDVMRLLCGLAPRILALHVFKGDCMGDLMNWFIPEEFMPHGHCYLWDPSLLRQIVISNALIGLSYFSIPLALIYLVRKRKDIEFDWIFFMFSAFIFVCGATHFLEIFTIWYPAYRLQAAVESLTAVLSVATVILLVKIMPKLMKIPSPAVLKQAIGALEHEVILRGDAENQLKRLNVELDEKVAKRTEELTALNLQMSATQRTLESKLQEITKINVELNDFAYVSSHDLKSPLRGIDQLASWIAEDLGDKASNETKKHLHLMQSRIRRMEMLLSDLLAYSKAGKDRGESVAVNTRDVVLNVFDLTTPLKPIECELVTKNLPTLQTQRAPLELVFRNLIGNAIKHHDKPVGHIEVSAELTVNGYAFVVKDDGPGIAPEHHKRVFGMFQTLKPRDEVEGSGMGLALVKKTVEARGGTVTLESDGEHGCAICFTWPIA